MYFSRSCFANALCSFTFSLLASSHVVEVCRSYRYTEIARSALGCVEQNFYKCTVLVNPFFINISTCRWGVVQTHCVPSHLLDRIFTCRRSMQIWSLHKNSMLRSGTAQSKTFANAVCCLIFPSLPSPHAGWGDRLLWLQKPNKLRTGDVEQNKNECFTALLTCTMLTNFGHQW